MDNIVFYQPPLALVSQPPRFPGTATASHLSLGPIASLPAHQIATHVSTKLQGAHTSNQNSRNGTQVSQNIPICSGEDDDEYFQDIEELLSGTLQKTLPASVGLNGNDHDGFINIDTVLSDMQQKIPTSVDSDYKGMADMVDSETRGGREDPIILIDDESVIEGSKTGCSDFDVDKKAKSYYNRRAAGYQEDDNSPNCVIEQTPLRLSPDRSITLSLDPEPEIHCASKLPVNISSIQQSMVSASLDLLREMEDERCDTFAEGYPKGDDSTSKRANLPALFDKNRALDNAVPELQDDHVEDTRVPQLLLTATSPRQSDFKNSCLRKRLRRGGRRDARYKRPHTAAPIRPAITDLIELKSRMHEEGELGLVDEEQDDEGCADESDNEDYSDMSKAAGFCKGGSSRSRKRVKRATNTEPSDTETPLTRSLNNSRQATAASSSGMLESEEVPICGYLTLKAMESKVVVYCLTFSQQLAPELSNLSLKSKALSVSSNESPTKATVSVNDSKEYVVERILGKRQKKLQGRGSRTRLEYQVKWQGYAKTTWEPAIALEDTAALDAYLKSGKGSNI